MLGAKMPKPLVQGGDGMAKSYQEGLQEFWAEAEKAYENMFTAERQSELKTFTQREVRVYEEGRRLSRWLLERHLEQDRDSQPEADSAPCPKCKRPSGRKGEGREIRPVTTLIGGITFGRTKFHCKHCRKSFFPAGLHLGIAPRPAKP
jgi:hypothetical protein